MLIKLPRSSQVDISCHSIVILHCLALHHGMDSLLSLHWVLLSHDVKGHHLSVAELTESALMLHHELASARRLVSSLDILEIVFDLKVRQEICQLATKSLHVAT